VNTSYFTSLKCSTIACFLSFEEIELFYSSICISKGKEFSGWFKKQVFHSINERKMKKNVL